jgi:putative ABC transport system permease protein
MALGATSGNVVGLIVRQGLVLAVIGLALGLAGAFAASRLLSTMLFEIKPADPATYAAVAGVVSLVVLAASYLPAVRATRIDPLAALRQD